ALHSTPPSPSFVFRHLRHPPRTTPFPYTTLFRSYLLANLAYVITLGAAGLAASTAPASDTMRALLGPAGGTFIATGIVLSTFGLDRKSTRLNSSHVKISYAVFCLKKKNKHLKWLL